MKQLDITAGSCAGGQSFVRLFNNASQAVTTIAVASKSVPSPQKLEDTGLFLSFCFDGILLASTEWNARGRMQELHYCKGCNGVGCLCPWKGPLIPTFSIADLVY